MICKLPYSLPPCHKRALDKIIERIMENYHFNSVIQGDAGTEKEVIAFLIAIFLAENGYQSVIEVSRRAEAKRLYQRLQKLVEGKGIEIGFWDNSFDLSERIQLTNKTQDGRVKIVVVMDSQWESKINFQNLRLVVTNDNNRFGIDQWKRMIAYNRKGIANIVLPKTIAPDDYLSTLFECDLEIYNLQLLPEGKAEVKSAVSDNQRMIFNAIEKELEKGRQTWIICSCTGTKSGAKSVGEYEELCHQRYGDKYKIACLDGKMGGCV
ncbi:MAG: hypothetical protein IJ274_04085 [Lachnospiraceae bacterium]|nr:hypothetical protein [Lachnospiraceae bacterium]